MQTVNIFDARNNLSRLITAASAGDEIVVANRGKPVAKIVAVEPTPVKSGSRAAAWLVRNPPPTGQPRGIGALDAQIRENLESWE